MANSASNPGNEVRLEECDGQNTNKLYSIVVPLFQESDSSHISHVDEDPRKDDSRASTVAEQVPIADGHFKSRYFAKTGWTSQGFADVDSGDMLPTVTLACLRSRRQRTDSCAPGKHSTILGKEHRNSSRQLRSFHPYPKEERTVAKKLPGSADLLAALRI